MYGTAPSNQCLVGSKMPLEREVWIQKSTDTKKTGSVYYTRRYYLPLSLQMSEFSRNLTAYGCEQISGEGIRAN